jgi:hypothetical protein
MSEPDIKKEEAAKPRSSKLRADRALPQSSADTLVKIIKAYAVASNGGERQVNYKDVASAAGLNPAVVSASNRFLAESEILSSPKYGFYVPSEDAVRFAREAAWEEDAAKAHLRRIIGGSWYGQVTIQNLSLRPSLARENLKKSLAIKCGAGEGDSNALGFLIDFIVYTGLVDVDDAGAITRGNFDEIGAKAASSSEPALSTGISGFEQSRILVPEKDVSLIVHIHIHDFADMTTDRAIALRQWINLLKETSDSVDVEISPEQSPPTDE